MCKQSNWAQACLKQISQMASKWTMDLHGKRLKLNWTSWLNSIWIGAKQTVRSLTTCIQHIQCSRQTVILSNTHSCRTWISLVRTLLALRLLLCMNPFLRRQPTIKTLSLRSRLCLIRPLIQRDGGLLAVMLLWLSLWLQFLILLWLSLLFHILLLSALMDWNICRLYLACSWRLIGLEILFLIYARCPLPFWLLLLFLLDLVWIMRQLGLLTCWFHLLFYHLLMFRAFCLQKTRQLKRLPCFCTS